MAPSTRIDKAERLFFSQTSSKYCLAFVRVMPLMACQFLSRKRERAIATTRDREGEKRVQAKTGPEDSTGGEKWHPPHAKPWICLFNSGKDPLPVRFHRCSCSALQSRHIATVGCWEVTAAARRGLCSAKCHPEVNALRLACLTGMQDKKR